MVQTAAVSPIALRTFPLFQGLGDERLQSVSRCAMMRRVPRGQAVVHAGDAPDYVYFVITGSLKVLVSDEDGAAIRLCEKMRDKPRLVPVVGYALSPDIGQVVAAMQAGAVSYLGWPFTRTTLTEELARVAPRDQILHIDLKGRDPDDGMNQVPYLKGELFLRLLEQHVGRARFDTFLQAYFDHFAFRSITTSDFVAYLNEHLLAGEAGLAETLGLDAWLEQPGIRLVDVLGEWVCPVAGATKELAVHERVRRSRDELAGTVSP